MLGRAAYHNTSVLADVDRLFYGDYSHPVNWAQVRDALNVTEDRPPAMANSQVITISAHTDWTGRIDCQRWSGRTVVAWGGAESTRKAAEESPTVAN